MASEESTKSFQVPNIITKGTGVSIGFALMLLIGGFGHVRMMTELESRDTMLQNAVDNMSDDVKELKQEFKGYNNSNHTRFLAIERQASEDRADFLKQISDLRLELAEVKKK